MVDKKVIWLVLKQALQDKLETKCPTIAEMHTQLSKMTQEEKNNALKDKLNPAEKYHYEGILSQIKTYESAMRDSMRYIEDYEKKGDKGGADMSKQFLKRYESTIESYEKGLFKYERRIFDGYKPKTPNPVPDVDISRFTNDNTVGDDDLGKYEAKMIKNQKKVKFNKEQSSSLIDYFSSAYALLNSKLNNGHQWRDLTSVEKKEKGKFIEKLDKNLHEAINSTNGLTQDTALYHGGVFDVSLVPGDKIHFKGYTSASFQREVAEEWISEEYYTPTSVNYVYRILTPTGTKGVCANDDTGEGLTAMNYEHEYLLDKDLEGTIIDVDPKNHLVTVLKE